ncbi:MAG: heparinase II/III family protein [Sedimentisphaeraceae bacterium JB056]
MPTKISKTALLLTVFLSFLGLANADIKEPDLTAEDISNSIRQDLKHPYLHFTEADKPAIRERIQNDPICKRIYAEMKEKADSYINSSSRPRRPDTQALAFVYQMTGDKRYAQKAFEYMPDEYPEIIGSFDLNNSRKCRGLAPMYDWLYTGLTEEQRAHLRTGLERQLALVKNNYDKTWWVTAYRCNWNMVCNSSVGVAAAALLADDSSWADVMADAYNSMYKAYDELGRDGDWCEGVNYRSYGVFVSMLYADSLKIITDGKLNLFEHEKIKANPVSFILHTLIPPAAEDMKIVDPRGRIWKSVNYEDSGDKREDSPFTYNKMALETGRGEAIWIRDHIFEKEAGSNVFDIIWYKPDIPASVPQIASKHFRDYDWSIMRSDFDSYDKVIVSSVCAEHWDPTREVFIVRFPGADPIPASDKPYGIELKKSTYHFSHGHLHAGTFNVYWQGQAFICDLGVPSYPKDYWSADRWDHIFANSFGHNVVHVNDEPQYSGRGVGGEIVEFRTSEGRDYTLMDPTGAYRGQELKGWRRHLVLDKPTTTVVLDEIKAEKGDDISIRFHSDCDTEHVGRVLMLNGANGKMALIPVNDEMWTFQSGQHILNKDYPDWSNWHKKFENNIREYTDVMIKASGENTLAATIILPVKDLDDAEKVAASATLKKDSDGMVVISYQQNGETNVFEFANKDGYLSLKDTE